MIFYVSCTLALVGFTFFLPTVFVSACEGDCITGITRALVGNYSIPFDIAAQDIADSIVSHVIERNNSAPPISYLSPIIEEYNKRSTVYMENTIFKTYFHGKCQDLDTGLDPEGCPNPDCPVVCGTPGSLIHFYGTLRYRAFNSTVNLWNEIIQPGSNSYKQVEKTVLAVAASSNSGSKKATRRRLLRFMRASGSMAGHIYEELPRDNVMLTDKRKEEVVKRLRANLQQFHMKLLNICGGTSAGKTNGLPSCSWEKSFKEYILSFP